MIKTITNNALDRLMKSKVYFSRASTYVSILNFGLIFATYFKVNNINIPFYILLPIGGVLVSIIGFIDYKLIYNREFKYINKQNDIKEQLDRIEGKLKK